MSLCDACFNPGACCKNIYFYGGIRPLDLGAHVFWFDEPIEPQLEGYLDDEHKVDGKLPWVEGERGEVEIDPESNRPYGLVSFVCTKLQANGRCGVYDRRPKLCAAFTPQEEPLCVHYRGAESGDPTIQLNF